MPHGGPATGPCPSPAMQTLTQSSGPKPWPEGECGMHFFLFTFYYTDSIFIIKTNNSTVGKKTLSALSSFLTFFALHLTDHLISLASGSNFSLAPPKK